MRAPDLSDLLRIYRENPRLDLNRATELAGLVPPNSPTPSSLSPTAFPKPEVLCWGAGSARWQNSRGGTLSHIHRSPGPWGLLPCHDVAASRTSRAPGPMTLADAAGTGQDRVPGCQLCRGKGPPDSCPSAVLLLLPSSFSFSSSSSSG